MRAAVPMIVLLMLAACERAPDQASAKQALLAANAAYDKALLDGDVAALQRFYHDEFQLVDQNGDVHDKQNQIKFMTETVDLLQGKGEGIQVEMLAPDAALLTGRFVSRYRMEGKEANSTQRFTSLWLRDGEDWRVRHEHVSNVRPAPAATASAPPAST